MAYYNGNKVLFSANVNIAEGSGGGVKDYAIFSIYNKGDIVSYQGKLYTPLTDNTDGAPTNTSKWKELASAKADKTYVDANIAKVDKSEAVDNHEARITELAESMSGKADTSYVDAEITKVDKSETVDNHEARITEIEEHLAPKYIITDDKTAYRKDVPANACSKAQLNSIGGMTYIDETTNTFVDAKVTELKAHGANLIPFPYKNTSKTEKGVTYTVNEDGTVVLNGTSTARYDFSIAIFSNLTAGKRYTMSGCPSGGSVDSTYAIYVSEFLNGVWQNEFFDKGSSVSFTAQEGFIYNVYISVWKENIQFNNLTFKPMLNYGETALPYEPFKEAETIFQIPPEIQALPNYGKMFTELDLVNKKYIDEYAEMDGVVSWNENPVSVFEEWGGDDGVTVLGYDCSVQFMRGDLMDDGNIGLVMTEKPYDSIEYVGTQFILHKRVAQLNSFGSNFDNYEIAEELFGKVTIVAKHYDTTEYDISAYIDNNIIKVTAGGAIEFVNENKQPVPSSVSFMMGGHLFKGV